MMLYLLTIEAFYDHGCAGIFTDRAAAEAHAAAILEPSDWHHGVRIEEIPVNVPITDSHTLGYEEGSLMRRHWRHEPDLVDRIEFVPWDGITYLRDELDDLPEDHESAGP